MVSIKHLSKTFHNPDGSELVVLKDVNCEIEKGEVISIIGPSGTGKSTLLRAMNMLEPPTSGEIWVDGENITAKGYPLEKLRRKMGMVFQSFNLFEHMTVLQNIIYAPMRLLKMPEQQAKEEAMELLRRVGLAKSGLTMLIVTHEMRFARNVSTRIFFMNEGIIYEDGTPEQIFNHPVRSATKAFVNRIQKLVYDIDSVEFDFLQVHTDVTRFCIKNNISELAKPAHSLIKQMLFEHMAAYRPITVRMTYTELTGETALDFMVESIKESPLTDEAREQLRQQTKQLIEEMTVRGFRIKLIL